MPSGKRGRFPVGTPVLDAARQLGVYVESVCGGRATCGRCQIEVQEGNFAKHKIVSSNDHISPKGPKEERYERVRGLPERRRLSCSAQILGDLVIDVPQDTVINAQTIRKDADTRVIARDTAIRMCYVEIEEPDMHKPLGDLDRLKIALDEGLGLQEPRIRLLPAAAGARHIAQGQLDGHRRHLQGCRQRDRAGHRPVAGPQERGLWAGLRYRLDHHCRASGGLPRAAPSPRPAPPTRRSASAKT